jgi:hypothetical protein
MGKIENEYLSRSTEEKKKEYQDFIEEHEMSYLKENASDLKKEYLVVIDRIENERKELDTKEENPDKFSVVALRREVWKIQIEKVKQMYLKAMTDYKRLLIKKGILKKPEGTERFNLENLKLIEIELLFDPQKRKDISNGFVCCCPFHQEKTGSFHVYKKDNHFHCFGCGAHGNSIEFVKLFYKVDFKEACRMLEQF